MTKILLTGRNGQVGWELERRLAALGEVVATDRTTLNLEDPLAIRHVVRAARPDIIVNAAAYTAVDRAESEPELAAKVNALAPAVLAEEARHLGAALVHFSTDYVFDGRHDRPYVEGDPPNPLSVYGRTKLEGERAVLESGSRCVVLRTSWVYAPRGRNFFLTIIGKARTGEPLRVVDDQHGVPNSAAFIADMTCRLLERIDQELRPLYHVSAAGSTTWHGFARQILSRMKLDVPVSGIRTEDYPAAAMRPRYAVLDAARSAGDLGVEMPSWESLLDECVAAVEAATFNLK